MLANRVEFKLLVLESPNFPRLGAFIKYFLKWNPFEIFYMGGVIFYACMGYLANCHWQWRVCWPKQRGMENANDNGDFQSKPYVYACTSQPANLTGGFQSITRLVSHGGNFHLQGNSPSPLTFSMPRGFGQQTRHCQWRFTK